MCYRQFQASFIKKEDGSLERVEHPYVTLRNEAVEGQVNKVAQYLAEHPDFNIDNPFYYGVTLLKLAVQHKQYNEADWLVKHGANPHYEFGTPQLSIYMPSAYKSAEANDDTAMMDILNSNVVGVNNQVVDG